MPITSTKDYWNHIAIKAIFALLALKFAFSYLNVRLGWWQRMLMPNVTKYNPLGLPQDTSRYLEFLIIPLIFFLIFRFRKDFGALKVVIGAIAVMFLLNLGTFYINEVGFIDSLEYTFKVGIPILFFCCLVVHYKKTQFNISKYLNLFLLFVLFLAVVGILLFDPSFNHGRNWLPVYFASLHTHTYVMVSVGIGLSFWFFDRQYYLYLLIFLLGFFLFVYGGYGIRSSLVFFAIFFFAITFNTHTRFKVLWIQAASFLPLLLVVFLVFLSQIDFNEFSSGRLTMYEAKYEILKGYNAEEYFFGRGYGSDYITTTEWWYDEKNSHNDILTFIVENGIPYALLFVGLIFYLMIYPGRIKLIYISILLGYLATSLLSNGIATRTLAGYLLFMVLARAYLDEQIQRNQLGQATELK
jgi:ABC-type multidrug transport system fused ATPase/permease subunit